MQTKKQHGNETRACDQRQEGDDDPTLGVLARFQIQRVCNVRRSRSGWGGKAPPGFEDLGYDATEGCKGQ